MQIRTEEAITLVSLWQHQRSSAEYTHYTHLVKVTLQLGDLQLGFPALGRPCEMDCGAGGQLRGLGFIALFLPR